CNGGHNAPLVIRADGSLEPLASTGLPLAMLAGTPYARRAVDLGPGDRVFFYTDGVTEAHNAAGGAFGEARLAAALEQLRRGWAQQLVEGVLERVANFSEGAPRSDDQACLALVYAPRDGSSC